MGKLEDKIIGTQANWAAQSKETDLAEARKSAVYILRTLGWPHGDALSIVEQFPNHPDQIIALAQSGKTQEAIICGLNNIES